MTGEGDSGGTEANVLVSRPTGRVDEATWETFLASIKADIEKARGMAVNLVIDLEQLEYMSSRGLRALIMAKREADAGNVGIRLARPNEMIREILAISRYDKIFTVTDTLEG